MTPSRQPLWEVARIAGRSARFAMGVLVAHLFAAGGWALGGYLGILAIAVLATCLIKDDKRRADAARVVLFLLPRRTSALRVLAPLLAPGPADGGDTAATPPGTEPLGKLLAASEPARTVPRKRRRRARRRTAPAGEPQGTERSDVP